jgi:hypothetical protein
MLKPLKYTAPLIAIRRVVLKRNFMSKLNLFATVLTYPAPASNYRGESEENRTVLQKITKDGQSTRLSVPNRCVMHSGRR